MRVNVISRVVRQLSGQGALDNVYEVLEARASLDAQLAAFAARVTPRRPVAVETSAAA